ncbi:hypothetical protein [Leifsonia sp. EB34]|uniref:hypothetical protein n=1 Tax=Leifsonia sp. EB34 TaxID=3156303 RepID=UPI0035141735
MSAMLAACTPQPGGSSADQASSQPSTSSVPSKPSPTPTPTVTVEPVLVVASVDVDGKHVTASGYVQGVIQDGGACTYTFTREGSPAVKVQHEGVADRSTTSCGEAQPDIAQFTRGSWQVTLEYVSDGKDYVSTPLAVEVP